MSTLPPPTNPGDLGRGPMIMGVTWTFTSLAIIAVALRFYVRFKLSRRPGLDDWLMGLALALDIVSQAFVTVGYHYGLGKHDVNLLARPDQMINVLKWMWLANTPGLLVSIIARISIAVLLVQLFGVHKWFKWTMIIVTGICTVVTIIIIPCTYLQVSPVSGNWNIFEPSKRWNPRIYIDMAFLGQALWTFTDLIFVLLPVMIIWRLNMNIRKRLGLVFLMSMSLLTMTISILKTVSLQHIIDQQSDPTATDVQYDATLTILWTCLEQAFVITMGCVPVLSSLSKLKLTKSISNSLNSILRFGRSSTKSVSSLSSSNTEKGLACGKTSTSISGPYTNLSMSKTGPMFTANAAYDGRMTARPEDPTLKNSIRTTTEFSITQYAPSSESV